MPRKISITFETNGNDAFGEFPTAETTRILREAARRLDIEDFPEGGFYLKDHNGNTCGRVDVEDEED